MKNYNNLKAVALLKSVKKIIPVLIIASAFFACNNKSNEPDVSDVKIDWKFRRFDQEFFSIDTNKAADELKKLYQQYPVVTPIFLQNILGLDSASAVPGTVSFFRMSQKLYDNIQSEFRNTNDIEKDFKTAFQFLKYYFPEYPIPEINTVAGPVNAIAQSSYGPTPDFLAPGILGISLQFYLGSDFSLYNEAYFAENVAPAYRSRRFSREFMIADALQLIISDLFPYTGGNKPLVEQMVEKGKRWWLMDKLIPNKHDTIKTGYTRKQLEWCEENEGLIWSYIVKNEDLQSLNPSTIQSYIGEGPFTQGFNQELSPGNLGSWIGWQIVKKYVDRSDEDIHPKDLMQTDPKKILEEARYKPK